MKNIFSIVTNSALLTYHNKSHLQQKQLSIVSTPKLVKNIYYKVYPRFSKLELPELVNVNISLKEAFEKRSSLRSFNKTVSLQIISTLLYYSAGINFRRIKTENRHYPSAGARYSLETYILANKHKKLQDGLFHYNIRQHSLEQLPYQPIDPIEIIGKANNNLSCASLFFIVTSVFNRLEIKYGIRAYRYALLEAGHMMQNITLIATSLNIAACPIGGFIDSKINSILDIEAEKEQCIYMCAIG